MFQSVDTFDIYIFKISIEKHSHQRIVQELSRFDSNKIMF